MPKQDIPIDLAELIIKAAIAMERIQGTGYRNSDGPAAFTADGRAFSVVFTRGLLNDNDTEYNLRLFIQDRQAKKIKHSSILRLTSFGNEPAISAVKWLPDGHTLAFLGAVDDGTPQVYTYNTLTQRLIQRTAHVAPIIDYDMSNDGKTIVYLARELADLNARERQRLHGVIARDGEAGYFFDTDNPLTPNVALVVQHSGDTAGQVVTILPGYDSTAYVGLTLAVRLSPDARYAVFAVYIPPAIPDRWRKFDNELVREFINLRQKAPPAYGLADLSTGMIRPLMDAPSVWGGAAVTWAKTMNHIAVTGYLPIDSADSTTLRVAKSGGALIEVEVPNGQTRLIKEGLWQVISWSPSGDTIMVGKNQAGLRGDTTASYFTLIRRDGKWIQIDSVGILLPEIFPRHALTGRLNLSPDFLIGVAQALDSPPELGVYDISTSQAQVPTNFNASLKLLPRGGIKEVNWVASDGVVWKAHLVTPYGYSPKQKYPAVVMIMDMSFSDRYVLDGRLYRASYPIQALASQNIAVLMVYFPKEFFSQYAEPEERAIILAGTDGAVRYLIDRGIADSLNIAITGFSHAGYVVEYAIQQSQFRYASAVAIDNWDASYFGYVLAASPLFWNAHEQFYGGMPTGAAREQWFQHAPGFNSSKVRTPLLLETHNSHHSGEAGTRVFSWEVYSSLKRYGKPVELVRYTYGEHTMIKPLEQFSSATRQVDWLRFWLQGYEDPSPEKGAQYTRWRRLRAQQERNAPEAPLPAGDK